MIRNACTNHLPLLPQPPPQRQRQRPISSPPQNPSPLPLPSSSHRSPFSISTLLLPLSLSHQVIASIARLCYLFPFRAGERRHPSRFARGGVCVGLGR